MSHYILYYRGAYNIYSTVIDMPLFKEALTLDQLKHYIKDEEGYHGLRCLPSALERAHKKGTCSMFHPSLAQAISNNHAGTKGTLLPIDKFIEKFLILKDEKNGKTDKRTKQT